MREISVAAGDNKLTAEAVCREIGVLDGDSDVATHSITGRDFAALSKPDQLAFLGSANLSGRVFSRAEPRHKQDIVRLLKEQGEATRAGAYVKNAHNTAGNMWVCHVECVTVRVSLFSPKYFHFKKKTNKKRDRLWP